LNQRERGSTTRTVIVRSISLLSKSCLFLACFYNSTGSLVVCSGNFTDLRFQAVGWHPSVKKSSTFELVIRGAEMALKFNLKSECWSKGKMGLWSSRPLAKTKKAPPPLFGVGGQRTQPEQPPTSCRNADQARGMAHQDCRPHPPQEQGVCSSTCLCSSGQVWLGGREYFPPN